MSFMRSSDGSSPTNYFANKLNGEISDPTITEAINYFSDKSNNNANPAIANLLVALIDFRATTALGEKYKNMHKKMPDKIILGQLNKMGNALNTFELYQSENPLNDHGNGAFEFSKIAITQRLKKLESCQDKIHQYYLDNDNLLKSFLDNHGLSQTPKHSTRV